MLWLVQVPLASRLDRTTTPHARRSARRCSSARSRHPTTSDGGSRPSSTTAPVQDLAGISYSLSAAAQTGARPPHGGRLAARGRGHARRDAPASVAACRYPSAEPPRERARGGARRPRRAAGAHGVEIELDRRPRARARATMPSGPSSGPPRRRCETSAARRATQRHVSVERDDAGVRLDVTDDGAGFAPDDRGAGARTATSACAARGARRARRRPLDVRSAPGEGTTVPAGASAR